MPAWPVRTYITRWRVNHTIFWNRKKAYNSSELVWYEAGLLLPNHLTSHFQLVIHSHPYGCAAMRDWLRVHTWCMPMAASSSSSRTAHLYRWGACTATTNHSIWFSDLLISVLWVTSPFSSESNMYLYIYRFLTTNNALPEILWLGEGRRTALLYRWEACTQPRSTTSNFQIWWYLSF
jgi:hypothetical protein